MLRGTGIRPDMTVQIAWGQDGWPTSLTVEVDDGNEDEARRYVPEATPAPAGNVTDDERRRVAAELRLLGSALCQGKKSRITIDDLRRVLFARPCPGTTADRLADLIEPTCDRDALLRVAGELDATSDTPVGSVTLSTHVLWDWFDRICAACGVAKQEPLGRHHVPAD